MPKTRPIQTSNLLSAFQQETETLLRVTPSIMIIFEMDGEILIANDAAVRFLRCTVTSILGKNIYKLFKFEDAHLQTYTLQLAQSLKEVSFEDTSKERKFSCVLSPMLSEGNVVRVVLSAQDVTERRHTEEQLRALTQELDNKVRERTEKLQKANQKLLQDKQRAEFLANFSGILIKYASDFNGLLQRVSDEINKLTTDGWCIITLFSDDQTHLKIAALSYCDSQAAQKIRALITNKVYSIQNIDLGELWQQNEDSINRLVAYERISQILPSELFLLLKKEVPVGIFGIPLLFQGHILGAIFIIRSDSKPLFFSSEDISFFKNIANPLALSIKNAKLFEDIKENREQLRGLSQQMVDLQEMQIKNLARELHDGVGQNLTAININLSLLKQSLPENYPDGLLSRLADTSQIVEETVVRMRNVMADFLPPMLESYGLSPALLWYSEQFKKRTNIQMCVNDYSLNPLRLPPHAEVGLFRIVQEALNNTAKYAHATHVNIEMKDDGNDMLMTITDNGVGFDPQVVFAEPAHWGFAIMRERARALDASFNIESAPGKGTKILLRIAR